MGNWAKAAVIASALMMPAVAQAQANERNVGDWLLTEGDKSCVASVGDGDQVFSMFTVGQSSGFYMVSPAAEDEALDEENEYDMQLGDVDVTFRGWAEKIGDIKGYKVPISISSLTKYQPNGYKISASREGRPIFSLELRRPGTPEVFTAMTECETRLRGKK